MLTFVYGVCPVYVEYRDVMPTRVMTDGSIGQIGGMSVRLGHIVIGRQWADNAGLLAHELLHQKQEYRRPLSHRRRYTVDPLYRLRCEAEAYRGQLVCYTDFIEERVNSYAYFLANAYDLPITVEAAKLFILNEV